MSDNQVLPAPSPTCGETLSCKYKGGPAFQCYPTSSAHPGEQSVQEVTRLVKMPFNFIFLQTRSKNWNCVCIYASGKALQGSLLLPLGLRCSPSDVWLCSSSGVKLGRFLSWQSLSERTWKISLAQEPSCIRLWNWVASFSFLLRSFKRAQPRMRLAGGLAENLNLHLCIK